MLTVSQVSKSYGIETILQSVSLNVSPGERLGLVGPNGAGKTTLLRIITGAEKPDSGSVTCSPPSIRIGYLPQGFDPAGEAGQETLATYMERMAGGLPGLTARLEELAAQWSQGRDGPELQAEYDQVLSQIQIAAENAGAVPAVMAALGLDQLPLELAVKRLSGGQKTRLALAGILVAAPHLLLLDEPTNHLDLDMLAWLEEWLNRFSNAALIVSHDRLFLDRTVTGILELDPQTHGLKAYPGNYSDYLEQKLAERARHWQEYSDQQEEIARLRAAALKMRGLAKFKVGGKADTDDKFAKGFFANRGKETVSKAKNIERRLERLQTEERIDKPRSSWEMKLEFDQVQPSGRDALALQDLSVGYGERALVANINQQVRAGSRVALVGPNGAGKTTLLRTITGAIPALSGQVRLGANVRLGYMAQEQENLPAGADVLTTIRQLAPFSETEARNFLHYYLFAGDDVFIPVEKLSYGERARLSLACLVASGCNLLLLDEPVNHLDIPSRARFEQALARFEGTVLAVIHDRYFIEAFASEVWEVRDGKLDIFSWG